MPEKNYGRCASKGIQRCLRCWRNKMNHGNKLKKSARKQEIHGTSVTSAPGNRYSIAVQIDMYLRYRELQDEYASSEIARKKFLSERYHYYKNIEQEDRTFAKVLAQEDFAYYVAPKIFN